MTHTRFRMPLRIAAVAAIAALVFSACSDNGDGSGDNSATPPATIGGGATPGATAPAAADAPAENGYETSQVFQHIDVENLLYMKEIPGDEAHVLAVSQGGEITRADMEGAEEPQPFLDVSDLLIDDAGPEEGLLGLAFAPDYEESDNFYIYYSAGDPRRSVIARYTARGDTADAASAQIVLEVPQPFANHNGGALEFGPDGMLYIALGDGGAGGDPQGNGQNTDTLLGSILRIDVSTLPYTSPADNPFADGGGTPEIFAYGLRNPWRFTFDMDTGAIWAGDVGQNEIEEVDLIESGKNYGWNTMEGSECFLADDGCSTENLVLPRAEYTHDDGCSVTGGYVYRGSAMPELDGWYIYGDFCSGRIWAVDTEDLATPAVVIAESDAAISSFAQTSDGEVYALTFDQGVLAIARR